MNRPAGTVNVRPAIQCSTDTLGFPRCKNLVPIHTAALGQQGKPQAKESVSPKHERITNDSSLHQYLLR